MGTLMTVELTFTEKMLATSPADPATYEQYIIKKAEEKGIEVDKKDEIKTLKNKSKEEEEEEQEEEEIPEERTMIFHKEEDGSPFIYSYMIKGHQKTACEALRKIAGTESEKVKSYTKAIDTRIFVNSSNIEPMPVQYRSIFPMHIPLFLPAGGVIGERKTESRRMDFFARPMRGQTMRGPRITILKSETAPIGTKIGFVIKTLDDKLRDAIEEWLEYGAEYGLGAWRNAGWGKFEYKILEEIKE
jgi:uncharacterized protein (UPF0248 family)